MSRHSHFSEDNWRGFISGKLSEAQDRELVLHILSGCASCRDRISALQQELANGTEGSASELPHQVESGWAEAAAQLVQADEKAGQSLFIDLMQLDPGQQLVVARNNSRYYQWSLCQLVLEKAFSLRYDDPEKYLDLALVGVEIANCLPENGDGGALRSDIQARALAFLGNAKRLRSDFRGAEKDLAAAMALLGKGTGDKVEEGRTLRLLANLRYDQERFDESVQLARKAFRCHRLVEDRPRMAKSLIQEGASHELGGDPERALDLFNKAVAYIDAEEDPRLYLSARHAAVSALRRLGRLKEAIELLEEIRPTYFQLGDRINLARLRSLEGELAVNLDQPKRAEAALREACDVFIESGMPFPAALACLDLAMVLLQQNRRAEVKALATTTLPILEALEVPEEALAAILLIREVSLRDQADSRFFQELISSIQRVKTDSTYIQKRGHF